MDNAKAERRLAAIVAADIAGYSRLIGLDEDGTLAALKAHRRDVIDPAIEAHGGRIANTSGDGILMEFPSVTEAIRCSLEWQQAMVKRNEAVPAERRVQYRIGINLGDVVADGDDILGHGVNIAARLEGMAHPGGICVSQAVIDQIGKKLALDLNDLGVTALKNIEEPIRVYRVRNADTVAAAAAGGRAKSGAAGGDSTPRLPERPSVATMPFRNLSGKPEDDYIADGIGLGIQTLLVQLSGLFLVNACSDQAYREGRASAAEVLREKHVRYALEGGVQKAGSRIRVTAQLTDLTDGSVPWADRYDREIDDVFLLQDDITREIIASIGEELIGGNLDRYWTNTLRQDGTAEFYLRGLSHVYKFTERENAAARAMFAKLYEAHPGNPLGPGYIAMTHWLDATRGWTDMPQRSIDLAREWAEKSVAVEEGNDGLGHTVLASIRLRERDFDGALALSKKGLAFRANCPFLLGQCAIINNACGDSQMAVKFAREALSVRMIFPPPLINTLATAYRDSGEVDLSIPAAKEAARIDPGHVDALVTLCSDYALAGDEGEAREVTAKILEIDPGFSVAAFMAGHPYKDGARENQLSEMLLAAGLPA